MIFTDRYNYRIAGYMNFSSSLVYKCVGKDYARRGTWISKGRYIYNFFILDGVI